MFPPGEPRQWEGRLDRDYGFLDIGPVRETLWQRFTATCEEAAGTFLRAPRADQPEHPLGERSRRGERNLKGCFTPEEILLFFPCIMSHYSWSSVAGITRILQTLGCDFVIPRACCSMSLFLAVTWKKKKKEEEESLWLRNRWGETSDPGFAGWYSGGGSRWYSPRYMQNWTG